MQTETLAAQPLYRQLAMRIRHRIATRELEAGDRLPSLRAGAERWGVNLHTVRRAYESLAEEGLVETEPRRGTRVTTSGGAGGQSGDDLDGFVEWVTGMAAARFGLSRAELARRLAPSAEGPTSPVWVIECTASLARDLATRVEEAMGVPTRPWVLEHGAPAPAGIHLGTYYHYAEVREAVGPSRDLAFFGTRLDQRGWGPLLERGRGAGRVVVLGVDESTGRVIVSELESAVDDPSVEVELRVTHRPGTALAELPEGVPVLVSPENWDRLDDVERGQSRVLPVTLQPDPADLQRIAARFGWPERAGV